MMMRPAYAATASPESSPLVTPMMNGVVFMTPISTRPDTIASRTATPELNLLIDMRAPALSNSFSSSATMAAAPVTLAG